MPNDLIDGDTPTAGDDVDKTATATDDGNKPGDGTDTNDGSGGDNPEPNTPDGDKPEGDNPEGDKPSGDDGNKPDDDTKDGDDSDEENQGAPEEYEEFEIPEGYETDDSKMGDFKEWAKESGLSQKQAQSVINKAAKHEADIVAGQYKTWEETQDKWIAEGKADEEFGGDNYDESVGIAKKAIDQFGTDELKNALVVTGAGNHPEIIRAFYRVGKAMSEDTVNPNKVLTSEKKDAASILYPNKEEK